MNLKAVENNLKNIFDELRGNSSSSRRQAARSFSNISAHEVGHILRHGEVDLLLDVGANEGQFHDFVRKQLGFNGPIVSFEPNPDLGAELSRRREKDANWYVHQYALGAAPGRMVFNVYKDSRLSSFLDANASAPVRFARKFDHKRPVEVPVKTLDDFFEAHPQFHSVTTFLKLDTQGFDLEVLKGLQRFNSQVKFLQTEISVLPLYERMSHYTEAIRFTEELGFRLVSLVPVVRDDSTGHVIEFDALWSR
jgi:FkbM family methyltransferase